MRSIAFSDPSPASPARSAGRATTMPEPADSLASLQPLPSSHRLEVRSVTGACYTLVEEVDRPASSERLQRRYRTAYAGLPVVANDDGSFTIVDTHTRLVRVDRP